MHRHNAALISSKNKGGSTICVKHCADLDPNMVETYPALLMDVEQSTERHLCQGHSHGPTAIHLSEKEYVQRLDIIDNSPSLFPQPKCANIDRKNMYELPKYSTHTVGSTAVPSVYFELEHQHDNKHGTLPTIQSQQQQQAQRAVGNNENTG